MSDRLRLRERLLGQRKEQRFAMDDPLSRQHLPAYIRSLFQPALVAKKPIVIVCIGTDRSTGDALGPLVGSNLAPLSSHLFHVFGTLSEPVHASNLHQTLTFLDIEFPRKFVIAVDACLGSLENVGKITVGRGPLRPGAGVNKNLPPVGDCFITGTVNVGGFMEYFVLQNTRLSFVMEMANVISDAIQEAFQWNTAETATAAELGSTLSAK